MDDKLIKVKLVFDNVKEMRSEISILFDGLSGRISKLKNMYSDFVKCTKDIKTQEVKPFIFSLDSFYFQTRLLEQEFSWLKDYDVLIINRMYGEYYKLFKLIVEYVGKALTDKKTHDILKNKDYPKYDDLDDTKVYPFDMILKLNEDITSIISYLISILKDKELSLKQHTTNQNYGLNVDNFVSTFTYDVIVLQEQINLYEKYLDFFYHVHEKLLKRLITKISILEAQLNTDIKFEGGLMSRKKDSSSLISEINIDILSNGAARDLRKSITGTSSPIEHDILDYPKESYNCDDETESVSSLIQKFENSSQASINSNNITMVIDSPNNNAEIDIDNGYDSIDDTELHTIEDLSSNIPYDISNNAIDISGLTYNQKKNMKKRLRKKEKKLQELANGSKDNGNI